MSNISSELIEQKTKEYLEKGKTIRRLPDEVRDDRLTVLPKLYTHPDERVGRHVGENPMHLDPKLIGRSNDKDFPYSVLDAIVSWDTELT